jgi:hypothetical protein
MNNAPPSVEEARKKLIKKIEKAKSNKKINQEIKRLETKMDIYVETAEDWDDNNDGVPVVSKEKLDEMAAEIDELRKGRGRRTRKRRKKGGQTKKVKFSECLNNNDCDAPKVCYHQATGWNLPPSIIGTCVDLPAEFKKDEPSIKVNTGILVNNPLIQHEQIGIPHGSELLDKWWGGKRIGLWGNRIKKSMKRLKRKRRKTRKRKRKKSRKKRKKRRRRRTRK